MLDHLAEFERTAADLAAAFDAVDPAAAVPNCPGWTVADLALHIGAGQRWAAAILLSGREQQRPDVLRTTISWSDWYAATSAALAAAIRAVDPDEPCWNFAPVEQRAGFWARRRLHEAAVHLVDARQAELGPGTGPELIPAGVAADGVDEVFGVFLPRMLARGAEPAVTRPVGIHATDTGDRWTLTPGADAPAVARGRADGDAVVTGTAAELLLCLWKRRPAGTLTRTGDEAVATAFLSARKTP